MASFPRDPPGFQEGLEVLHEPTGATVDIVAVPGLGANPSKSWMWDDKDEKSFNWLKDDKGLKADFPMARIMRYKYASSYQGKWKIKQYLVNITEKLLEALQLRRENCERRPIVFLGHSMGGLVIAKALCICEERAINYVGMYESFAGCAFFGTPFEGAAVADIAKEWTKINEKLGKAIDSELIDLLRRGNMTLRELKQSFLRSVGKLSRRIELHCFYEQRQTHWDEVIRKLTATEFPKDHLERLTLEETRDFVSRESATLDGFESTGLAKTHRDLVKFQSCKDDNYQAVRGPLKRLINSAPAVAKARFKSASQSSIDPAKLKRVLNALDGADVERQHRRLKKRVLTESWVINEPEYQAWLRDKEAADDYLWVYGLEGKGKTSFFTSAVDSVQALIKDSEAKTQNYHRAPTLLTYFCCEKNTEFCTAEDLLKSILRQLCAKEDVLATYATQFMNQSDEKSAVSAHLGIENLWNCLRDMLTERTIGTVYFVIGNLHELEERDPSTKKLLSFIQIDSENSVRETTKGVRTRWLFISRNREMLRSHLGSGDVIHDINLDDDRFGDNRSRDIQRQAWTQAGKLQQAGGYNKAITYYLGSAIGHQAEDKNWVDVIFIQLAALPKSSSDIKVRQMLEGVPQDFTTLLNDAWISILKPGEDMFMIKELLRALVLAFEEPTEDELMVLVGSSLDDAQDRKRIRQMIAKCYPLLNHPKPNGQGKISFARGDFKDHLLQNAKRLLDLSENDIKLQHGILSWRCFSHVIDRITATPASDAAATDDSKEAGYSANEEQHDELDVSEDESVTISELDKSSETDEDASETTDEETTSILSAALPYATIYWIKHASQATIDIAERLSLEETFWSRNSKVRTHWLDDYEQLTNAFSNLGVITKDLNALHVAATIGFSHLVDSLYHGGHRDEIHEYDSLENQPLHLAALFGNEETVEQLLSKNVNVDGAGEHGTACTPLTMAAFSAKTHIMTKLIHAGANADAIADSIGPVINGAIIGGDPNAVRMLIDHGVRLSYDEDDASTWLPPLAFAGLCSDLQIVEIILEAGGDSLTEQEYQKALILASESGRTEVVQLMLNQAGAAESVQEALDRATVESNWDVVRLLLQQGTSLDCTDLFEKASIDREDLEDILELCQNHGELTQDILNSCLFRATDMEKQKTVELLLELGADPNSEGLTYGNALTAAAYDGTEEIVAALIGKGADVNATEGYALQAAAEQGHLEIVKMLLENGAMVDHVSDMHNSATALQAACDYSQEMIVEVLLEHNADVNVGGGEYERPIIAAVCQSDMGILKRLLHTNNVELAISGGPFKTTPIHYAALMMPVAAVEALIVAGADVNQLDPDGDTALLAATAADDEECVKLLLEHGANFLVVSPVAGVTALELAVKCESHGCVKLLVARATALLKTLKEVADGGNKEALQLIGGEIQTRKEQMAAEEKADEEGSDDAGDSADGDNEGDEENNVEDEE